jgi:hypothetical protein
MFTRATGAFPSPLDVRVFTYAPKVDLGTAIQSYEGGEKWGKEYVDDQHSVGICTSISLTMKAKRYFQIDFSPDFHYLIQKKFLDKNWNEGSSAYHSILAGYNYGFLPRSEWKYTTEDDRKGTYSRYISKLRAVPDAEIERLLAIAKQYKVTAFAKVPINRDALAAATLKCDGLIARFVIDDSWYTHNFKEQDQIKSTGKNRSGHIVNDVRFSGLSRRIVNSWGIEWSGDGTAFYMLNQIQPTEAWSVWFGAFPNEIQKQKEEQLKLIGQLKKILQSLIEGYRKLRAIN